MTAAQAVSALPRLAKYELVEEIGHGGMATVYRARDPRLLREVAVKVIHRHLRENAEVGARFVAEARAVAKLRHPNIVEVYDVSDEEDVERFLVVELLRGTTLRKLLAEHPKLPPEVGAAIGIEIAEALAHAHAAGVIHRDVKPENVLVEALQEGCSGDVLVKLTDFGIAKILDGQGVTHTGQVLGSPAYMAPEQIEGGELDARADVFGLGVLLYECMVGHPPFEGANPAQVLRRVLDGLYSPASRERATVGGRWSKILDRALAKAPCDRFASAEAVAEALRNELLALGIAEPKDELRSYFADPEGYASRQVPRLASALTLRGEAARRAGDRLGAAADFNRALAYAPDDAELLKQVIRLSRGARQLRAGGLVLAILGGSLVLGVSAFALFKPGDRVEKAAKPPPKIVANEARPKPPSTSTPIAAAAPSALPAEPARTTLPTRGIFVPARKREPAALATRNVRFELNPKGALVSIDGAAPEDLFGQAKSLSLGTHLVTLTVPNSSCCAQTSHRIEVQPGEGMQRFGLAVTFREARVTTQGAPEGALLRCPALNIEGAASRTFVVKMTSLEIAGTCWIDAPSQPTQSSSVTLRAGETATVPWR